MIWCWKGGVLKYWIKTSGWRGGGEGECRIHVFVYLDLCVYLYLYLYLRICDCVEWVNDDFLVVRRRMCERMRAGAATGNESPACCCVAANGRTTPGTATPPTKTRRTPGNKTHGDEARPARKQKEKSSTEIGDWNLGNKNSPEGKIAQYLRSKPTRCLFPNKILKQI